jgi:t-SNARE complex subunit (syntaxin)
MSLNPNFKRRATDKAGIVSDAPRERRGRKRRKAEPFAQEIGPMLAHVEPEVKDEISNLVASGNVKDAQEELLDYVVANDRAEIVKKIIHKKTSPIERLMEWRVYLISVIPVLIVLYYIFTLLTKGHIEAPWGH